MKQYEITVEDRQVESITHLGIAVLQ